MENLLTELKQNGQDFEWYPTTNEIIECMGKNIDGYSILDIGAGNGQVFKILNDFRKSIKENTLKCYAIEKSQILINQLPSNVFVIGTDFNQQTLIDKKTDVVFCNPPYKEYEQWAIKIIEQANCKQIFLVIPERWKQNKRIMQAIKGRSWVHKTLGSFDFLNAERQARAKVNLVMFEKVEHRGINDDETRPETKDPFEFWFNENFKINIAEDTEKEWDSDRKKKQKLENQIVKGESLIPRLVELYNKDMEKLLNNYKAIEQIDAELLKELGVEIDKIMESLKLKIKGLKNLYWQELFDNLDKVTNRLTSESRREMLDTLTDHTSVDFTCENAYAVVIWVIKNANKYFDSQILDIYLKLAEKDNIRNYKSNKRFVEDTWRYSDNKNTHYSLDYRIVVSHGASDLLGENAYRRDDGRAGDLLDDICTIADNLGFKVRDRTRSFNWHRGQEKEFCTNQVNQKHKNKDTEFKYQTFMKVRAYQNGNLHIKLNKEFMLAFNVEAGRLNGWLKDPKHASNELDIPIAEIQKHFKTNFVLLKNDVRLLENQKEAVK